MPIKAPKRGSWCKKRSQKGVLVPRRRGDEKNVLQFIKSARTLKDIHFQKYLLQNITDWDTATVGSRLKGQFSAVQVVWFK